MRRDACDGRCNGDKVKWDAQQLEAITRATSDARVTLISGAAGTGKSTVCKAIADKLDAEGQKPLLCAFAGKAAARLREACQRPTSTIHRMLGADGTKFCAGPDALEGHSILLDEASMVPADLLSQITNRKPKRLILVGDTSQLAPVGRGQPFHDISSTRPDLCVTLKTSYRNKEAVFSASMTLRQGNMPPSKLTSEGESWSMINTGDPERTQAAILQWVTAEGIWDFNKDVVLVPRNGDNDDDASTVRGLNRAIADALLPRNWSKEKFKVGDRVLNMKNNPSTDCWNGTTGQITAIDIDGGVWVKTDVPVIDMSRSGENTVYTDRVLFDKTTRSNLTLAYALTAHRAQGSQYRNVIVICLTRDAHCILDRAWAYTAATRATRACCIVGQLSALKLAIDQTRPKRTVLQELAAQENG